MRADRTFSGTMLVLLLLCASPWGSGASAICPSESGPSKPRPPPPPDPREPPPKPTNEPGSGPPPPPPTPITPRDRPPATPSDALHEGTWEGWWDLNRWDVLPRVRRQADAQGNDGYADTLAGSLRPAADLWIEALGDADDEVRRAAAAALAVVITTHRPSDTVAALERLLERGGDPYARDLAGLALARRRHQPTAPALRRILRHRGEVPVSRAFAGLGLIALDDPEGLADVGVITTELTEPELAGALLLALGETKDLRHLPVIRAAAERRRGPAVRLRRVRADAIAALGKLGCRATVPYLASLLADREKVISRSAALALGAFPVSEAVTPLREVGLASEDEFTRGFAAISLGRSGDGAVLPSLGPRTADGKENPAVKGFALLALGLMDTPVGVPLLREPLTQDPRTALYGAAALSAGLSRSAVYRDLLAPAVNDTRSARVPSCGAMALALIGDKPATGAIRSRAWLDSAFLRPGFAEALAQLDAESQSAWLLGQLRAAKRSSERKALVRALAFCGGPTEAAALVDLWQSTPRSDTGLRCALVEALVPVVTDRELSFSRRLIMHTYYLQRNIVLEHLEALP
jgi:HEAT repeat protein